MALEHLVGIDLAGEAPAVIACQVAHALVKDRELPAHRLQPVGPRRQPGGEHVERLVGGIVVLVLSLFGCRLANAALLIGDEIGIGSQNHPRGVKHPILGRRERHAGLKCRGQPGIGTGQHVTHAAREFLGRDSGAEKIGDRR